VTPTKRSRFMSDRRLSVERQVRIREGKINTGLLREPDCVRIPKEKPALQALFTFVSTYESKLSIC